MLQKVMPFNTLFPFFVIRENFMNKFPEGAGVVFVSDVCEFMNNHILNERKRRLYQHNIEREIVFAAATAPPAFVFAK